MWTIIWGDALYRIVAPDGSESRAVHYCDAVTLEYDGKVYGCYLTGDEEDDDMLVFDYSDFPQLVSATTQTEEAEFEGEDGTAEEIECDKCGGNGFVFAPASPIIEVPR